MVLKFMVLKGVLVLQGMVLQRSEPLAGLLLFSFFSRAADRCTLSRKPGFLIVLGGVRLQRNGINNTEKKRTCRLKPSLR